MKAENSTNILTKPKKLPKFQEFYFMDTLSDKNSHKFQQICNALSFPSFLSLFLLYKICFYDFVICIIFLNQYPK